MAKKKSAKKAASKKKAAPKKSSGRAKGPRSVPLPTMGQVRRARLDNICESINEIRTARAKGHGDESGDLDGAMRFMHDNGINSYHHAGVSLVRLEKSEKLIVKWKQGETSGNAEPEETGGEFAAERQEAVEGDDAEA